MYKHYKLEQYVIKFDRGWGKHLWPKCFFFCKVFFCVKFQVKLSFFLPTDLKLSPDVAGATFMATATCAPELFVNIIGTFLTESDLGLGTVVGSAVFNTLGVATCAGLAAKKVNATY